MVYHDKSYLLLWIYLSESQTQIKYLEEQHPSSYIHTSSCLIGYRPFLLAQ